MSRPRKHIPLKAQLAAALLQIARPTPYGEVLIPHDHAKQMTADQIISLFQLHHYPIEHADGGPDEPWNLEFCFIGDHKLATKRLAKVRAKVKRLQKKQIEAYARDSTGLPAWLVLGQERPKPKRKHRWPSRPFPKRDRSKEKKHAQLHRGGKRRTRD